jgi:hypothetical protein
MLPEDKITISTHFNTFTPHDTGYLQEKKYQPRNTTIPNEDEVEEDVEEHSKPAATSPNNKNINKMGTDTNHDEENKNSQSVDAGN